MTLTMFCRTVRHHRQRPDLVRRGRTRLPPPARATVQPAGTAWCCYVRSAWAWDSSRCG